MLEGTVATAAVLERELNTVRICLDAELFDQAAEGLLQVERFIGLLPDEHPLRAEAAQLVATYREQAATTRRIA